MKEIEANKNLSIGLPFGIHLGDNLLDGPFGDQYLSNIQLPIDTIRSKIPPNLEFIFGCPNKNTNCNPPGSQTHQLIKVTKHMEGNLSLGCRVFNEKNCPWSNESGIEIHRTNDDPTGVIFLKTIKETSEVIKSMIEKQTATKEPVL